MITENLLPCGIGGIALTLDTPRDQVIVQLDSAHQVNLDTNQKCPLVTLNGHGGAIQLSIGHIGEFSFGTAIFAGTTLTLSGAIGGTLTLPDGIAALNVSGLSAYDTIVCGPTNFPSALNCLGGALKHLTIADGSVPQGDPGPYILGGASLSEEEIVSLLTPWKAVADGGGSVAGLQIDVTGANAHLGTTAAAIAVALTTAGASVLHN